MGVNSIETLELLDEVMEKTNKTLSNSAVCDLGNQRAWPTLDLNIPVTRKGYVLKDYYKALKGVSSHVSIDLNGKDGALPLDLTEHIDVDQIGGPFTLVTNFGTSEHVPGQYWCFKNIHELTEVGGIMYHVVPRVGNWDGKGCGCKKAHCPYYYDTKFFSLLAEANGYKVIENRIWNHDHVTPKRAREECVAIFQKIENTEFVSKEKFEKFPIQYISNPEKTGNYAPGRK
jgi:hypothetical protein